VSVIDRYCTITVPYTVEPVKSVSSNNRLSFFTSAFSPALGFRLFSFSQLPPIFFSAQLIYFPHNHKEKPIETCSLWETISCSALVQGKSGFKKPRFSDLIEPQKGTWFKPSPFKPHVETLRKWRKREVGGVPFFSCSGIYPDQLHFC